jgi:hypothetical protein
MIQNYWRDNRAFVSVKNHMTLFSVADLKVISFHIILDLTYKNNDRMEVRVEKYRQMH